MQFGPESCFFFLEAPILGAKSPNQPALCCWLCGACCWNLSEGNSIIFNSFFSRLMAGRSIFTRITVRSSKPIKYELLFIGSYRVTCLCWRAEAPGFCTWLVCLCFPGPLDGAGVTPPELSAVPHIGQQMATDITAKGLGFCWKWDLSGFDSFSQGYRELFKIVTVWKKSSVEILWSVKLKSADECTFKAVDAAQLQFLLVVSSSSYSPSQEM